MKQTTKQFAGFTLIELIVSITIVSMMLFLINRIFFDTTKAVSRGIATSKIIANARAIGDQFQRDFVDSDSAKYHQVGPTDDGILVILNKSFSGITFHDPRANGGLVTRSVRSDQLMFIYNNGTASEPLEPLAPGSTGSFSNSTDAPYARIWYGHVLYTEPDGTDPTNTSLGNMNSLNPFGQRWALGRQALFLHETLTGVGLSTVHANGMVYYSPVVGYTSGTTLNAGVVDQLYSGLTDIAYFSFNDGSSAGGVANGFLVGNALSTALLKAGSGMTAAAYKTQCYDLTYGITRLRVNPRPGGTTFMSSEIAQMHSLFMTEVSDFIVEFAGDYIDNTTGATGADSQIDVDRSNPSFPAIDNDMNGVPYTYSGGNIIWYSHWVNNPRTPASYDSTLPALHQVPTGVGGFNDATPGPSYDTTSNPALSDAAFVFRHDDDGAGTRWPYLLRIRYRLHDPKGELLGYSDASGQAEPGKWFEIIINVNRD